MSGAATVGDGRRHSATQIGGIIKRGARGEGRNERNQRGGGGKGAVAAADDDERTKESSGGDADPFR